MNKKQKRVAGVSCIIPAYNEAGRIKKVIAVAKRCRLINEVIVINDGSTDNTRAVVKTIKGITFIDIKKNRGKSYAIMRGVCSARNDILLFLDSDLIGLRSEDLENLILPILSGKGDVAISLRKNAPLLWRIIGLDFISGERVFPKSLIENPKELLELEGFELEIFLNKKIIQKRKRIAVVFWRNVISPYPAEKYGFFKGNKRFLEMIWMILRRSYFFGWIIQILYMLSLKDRN